jgi:hypothetical protein
VILRLAWLAFALAAMLALAPARAAPPADQPPTWASLSKAQQAALAPLQRDWATIDAQHKQQWVEVARRFPRMPAAERQRVQARMTEWAHMTPAERTRARLQFQQARELTPGERQAKWQAYQALPADQRKLLAQRAKPVARSGSVPDPSSKAHVSSGNHRPTPTAPVQNSRPSTPIVVQAAPGATTTTLSTRPPHPPRHPAGRAKITTTPGLVDPATLLPRRGPQATVAPPAPVSSAPVKP